MLQLKKIVKDYQTGDEVVKALKGISINFRKNEFVSVLGQSGCGKTTLLNIIGGLISIRVVIWLSMADQQKNSRQETGIHTGIIRSVLYSRVTI